MSDKHLVTRPAAIFSAMTILSRILGLARDMLAACIFGASMFWDAFVVAFTFPNLFRRIFGEGALNAAFVPVFSDYMHNKGKQEAWKIVNIIVSLLTLVLVILSLVVLGILLFGRWFMVLSPRTDLIFKLSQIMFPYVIFICLVGLFMGILNAFHHLTIPALVPAVFNLILIIGMLSVRGFNPQLQVVILAFVVLFGGFIEFGMHIPVLSSKGMRYEFSFNWHHTAVKKILFLMGPMVLGFSITQINVLIDRILALIIGPGSVSTLYFGDRLIELPLGIFGIAIAIASLSVMSKQAARKDLDSLKDTLDYSLRIVFFIGLPASVGLIIMRNPIVKIIFERAAFTSAASISCAKVVFCYSFGLCAYLALKVITQCFYALQDTKTPVKVGASMVFLNFLLNILLMIPLKEAGLALATSICAFLNMIILMILLSKKLKGLFLDKLIYSFIRNGLAAGIMGIVCWLLTEKLWQTNKNIFTLLFIMFVGVLLYFLISIILGSKEPKEFISHFKYTKSSTQYSTTGME